ncbi:glycoside hydrolase domain-containing protein [Phycisphaerales bacterium AB-hyl4]|uniref:Glycoside hydrolase domain-containing protein n=1 Tax=Natronomicrosphaera hydrolytica TaxID=3242702 RepID=A0ABV4UBI0_9BACT
MSMLLKPTLLVLALVLFTQAALAGQVTILAPREDTRVDFERLGLRVNTYTAEQLTTMDTQTAIAVGQSIDESILVLTGAIMPAEAFEGLFNADPARAAFDDLFRRGGMFYIGQLNGATLNNLPAVMRDYFEEHDVFLPTAPNRPSASSSIGNFTAYANPDLLDLPLLSQPNSLAEEDWSGVESNAFYWRNFPDKALPVLVGPDNEYPVMLLQEGIFGDGKVIISQARHLTRVARSPFWENLIAYLGGSAAAQVDPATGAAGTSGGATTLALGSAGAGKPLMFLETFEDASFEDIAEADLFNDPKIWEAFETVELRIHDTGDEPTKTTQARLGVIGQYLVAAFHNEEPNPDDLVKNVTVRDGQAWTDDSVELVLVPEEGGSVYHWILSAGGAIYDARDRVAGWDGESTSDVRIGSDSWQAVLAVPLTEVFEGGEVPEMFFANLARNDRNSEETSSWVAPIHVIPTPESVGHISRLSPRELASRLVDRPATASAGPAAATGEGFDIWQVSAWEDGVGLTTRPRGDNPEPGTLELHVPGGGSDAAALLVRNHGPDTLVFKVNPPVKLNAGGGRSVRFYDLATLYQGVPRLSSYETLDFDPLGAIGINGVLTVGSGETAKLWVDVAGKAPAGRYRGELQLLPITLRDQTPVSVPIDVRIYDVEIPSPLPMHVYTFGPYMGALYDYGGPLDYVKLMLDSHINVFHVSYPVGAIKDGPVMSSDPADYLTNHAVYMREDRPMKFVYDYHLFTHFDTALKEAGFEGETMDDEWQAHFREWFGNFMDALKGHGLTYDDFWIQIEDEPRLPRMPDLVKEAAMLKEYFPDVQTTVTMAPWNTAEHIASLEPYVDMWMPERRRLTMREEAADELAFYNTQDAFWPFLCATRMDMQSLIGYYRHRGIQDYHLGVDGIALWAFNSWTGDSWAQWDSPRPGGGYRFNEGLAYRGEGGPVPSKRLFAFRAGMEDYVLLHLLAEAKSNASGANGTRIDALKSQAETLLGSSSPAELEQWRRDALALLETLQ